MYSEAPSAGYSRHYNHPREILTARQRGVSFQRKLKRSNLPLIRTQLFHLAFKQTFPSCHVLILDGASPALKTEIDNGCPSLLLETANQKGMS